MNSDLINNIIRFVVLVLVQGLILINVDLFQGNAIAFLYIYFILMLPLKASPLGVMLSSFFIGLAIDMFYSTAGIHASAALLAGFLRYYLISAIAPRDSYDTLDKPTIYSLGLAWFLQYSLILIFVHQLWLFSIDSIGAFDFGNVLKKTVLSTLFTFVLVVIVQYLFPNRSRIR